MNRWVVGAFIYFFFFSLRCVVLLLKPFSNNDNFFFGMVAIVLELRTAAPFENRFFIKFIKLFLFHLPSRSINVVFHLIHRQKQLNEQNLDYVLNWRENSNVPLNVKRRTESNAFTTNELIKTDNNRKVEKPMINGTDSSAIMSHRKPYTKLLRRRHSLPEIIMRK